NTLCLLGAHHGDLRDYCDEGPSHALRDINVILGTTASPKACKQPGAATITPAHFTTGAPRAGTRRGLMSNHEALVFTSALVDRRSTGASPSLQPAMPRRDQTPEQAIVRQPPIATWPGRSPG